MTLGSQINDREFFDQRRRREEFTRGRSPLHRDYDICGRKNEALTGVASGEDCPLNTAMAEGRISRRAASALADALRPRACAFHGAARIKHRALETCGLLKQHGGTNLRQAETLVGDYIHDACQRGYSDLLDSLGGLGRQRFAWYQREVHLGDEWAYATRERGEQALEANLAISPSINGRVKLGYRDNQNGKAWAESPKVTLDSKQPSWMTELTARLVPMCGLSPVLLSNYTNYTVVRQAWEQIQSLAKRYTRAFDGTQGRWEESVALVAAFLAQYQCRFDSLPGFDDLEASASERKWAFYAVFQDWAHRDGGARPYRTTQLHLDGERLLLKEKVDPRQRDSVSRRREAYRIEDRNLETTRELRLNIAKLSDPGMLYEVALRAVVLPEGEREHDHPAHLWFVGDPYSLWDLVYKACNEHEEEA